MKLYDWLSIDKGCYDCYDTDLDICVTIDWIDQTLTVDGKKLNDSAYDNFVIELTKKVEIIDKISDCVLCCKWSKLIDDNKDKFADFANKHWSHTYSDPDEFKYQWIKELHYYVAGEVPESFYTTLLEFVKTLQ